MQNERFAARKAARLASMKWPPFSVSASLRSRSWPKLTSRQLKLESGVAPATGHRSPVDSAESYESPGASLEAHDERRILLNRMERLDARERIVLALRYGLEGESPLILREIGRRLGITREWVRKIEIRRCASSLPSMTTHWTQVRMAGGPRDRPGVPQRRSVASRGAGIFVA